jgi:predicted dehydrogenase
MTLHASTRITIRRDERVSIAVVGLGYWGPNLLRVLSDREDVRVSYICDLDQARLKLYSGRYPSSRATSRLSEVLSDPAVDAVVFATPGFTHHDLGLLSLRAGKHTFVEKPLASSTADAEELVAVAQEEGLALMCGHTFLYSPAVRAVKGLLDRGDLGELYFISSSRVNLGLHQKDISVIWDLAPHDFSMLHYWLDGMPEWVSVVGRASVMTDVIDVAFIDLQFPSGVLAHVELSWLAPSKLRRTVLVGSEKMVLYDDTSPEPIRIFDQGVVYQDPETFGEYHLSYRTGDIVSPRLDSAEPLALEFDDFVAAVRAGGPLPRQGELACDVVRLIEEAELSVRYGGERRMLQPGGQGRRAVGMPGVA